MRIFFLICRVVLFKNVLQWKMVKRHFTAVNRLCIVRTAQCALYFLLKLVNGKIKFIKNQKISSASHYTEELFVRALPLELFFSIRFFSIERSTTWRALPALYECGMCSAWFLEIINFETVWRKKGPNARAETVILKNKLKCHFFIFYENGTPSLNRVSSFVSARGCDFGLPVGFSNTFSFVEWIEEMIAENWTKIWHILTSLDEQSIS